MGELKKYIVVDIGGTKIRTAQWDGQELSSVTSIETPKVSVNQFFDELNHHLSNHFNTDEFAGLGISSAGPIDVERGEILNPANLGDGGETWFRVPLKQGLLPQWKAPKTVDNDAAMTAYGQFKHVEHSQVKDLVLVTLGTGVGVGAVVRGQLARAGQNMHPEMGHLIVKDVQDTEAPTPLANFPTLESFLSGSHFADRVSRALGEPLNGHELIERSQQGRSEVMALWQTYAKQMALCFANLYLCYFPEKIVLAGGFAKAASPFFLDGAQTWLNDILASRAQSGMTIPTIELSPLYDELPLIGAGYQIAESAN